MRERREVHGERKEREGLWVAQGRGGDLEKKSLFQLCALLATALSLCSRRIERRGTRRYAPKKLTALTVLVI